jgi:hypothetical protein
MLGRVPYFKDMSVPSAKQVENMDSNRTKYVPEVEKTVGETIPIDRKIERSLVRKLGFNAPPLLGIMYFFNVVSCVFSI